MIMQCLLLIAVPLAACVVTLGVLAMLPPPSEHHARIKLGVTRTEIDAILERKPWRAERISGTSFSYTDMCSWSNEDGCVWVRFNRDGKAISIATGDSNPYEKSIVDRFLWLMR